MESASALDGILEVFPYSAVLQGEPHLLYTYSNCTFTNTKNNKLESMIDI